MCQTYFKKMTGLFLFLFFATVLGCSSPTERMVNRIRDFAGYEQELLDVFEKIQDKAALDAADSELRAVLAKLSEFNQDITSLNEEFYGPDPRDRKSVV